MKRMFLMLMALCVVSGVEASNRFGTPTKNVSPARDPKSRGATQEAKQQEHKQDNFSLPKAAAGASKFRSSKTTRQSKGEKKALVRDLLDDFDDAEGTLKVKNRSRLSDD